jgi:hypothetical protein
VTAQYKAATAVTGFWGSAVRAGCLFGILASSIVSGSAAQAVIFLRVEQSGNDVVVRGSGKANLTALTRSDQPNTFQNVMTDVQIYAGPSLFNSAAVDLYEGILTGPTLISSLPLLTEEPDSAVSSGNLFGIIADPYQLVLPRDYVSNTQLAGVSTFRNVSISDLGLTAGQWTWGNVGDGSFDSINLTVAPAPLPIVASAVILSSSRKLRLLSSKLKKSK